MNSTRLTSEELRTVPDQDTDRALPRPVAAQRKITNLCPRCGEDFATLTLFDQHQVVDYSRCPAVACVGPEALGMVRDHQGTWQTPEGLIRRQGDRERLLLANRARGRRRS